MWKWEFKIVEGRLTEEDLNKIGKEMWELVGVIETEDARIFYFKRKVIQ